MFKILLFAVIVTFIIIGSARYKKMDAVQKRKTLWRLGTGIFLGILILLVVTGKMHWIGAALGALLPFVRNAYGLISQLLPLWLQRKNAQKDNQTEESHSPQRPLAPMPIQEALEVLGLSATSEKGEITESMIQDAHRRLIQKLHPDRGGNDYLAAKINQARDLLLEYIKH
jgi:hypothetical protein